MRLPIEKDIQQVSIYDLGSHGEGIGRLSDGRVVFVEHTLPGDCVDICLTQAAKNIARAELIQIVKPSPHRIDSHCAVTTCGGCAVKSYALTAQRQLKRQRIVETLKRIAHVEIPDCHFTTVGEGWRYRHRVRLHAQWHKHWSLGYFARKSHALSAVSSCPVLWAELEAAMHHLNAWLSHLPKALLITEIEMAYSRHDKRAAAKIYSDAAKIVWRDALNTAPFGLEIVCKDGRLRHGQLELRYDHALKNEFDLFFESGVFTQAFPEVNDKLVEAVLAAVHPHELPRVLELHAGIGNFSIPLARSGAKLVAVEFDKRASVLLGRNARASGLDIEIHAKRDDEVTTELQNKDVVVLDPPRTGARTICEALVQTPVERIVYISCDPATLARDTALLSERYTISSVQGFDMFPQTPHVETLIVFKRMR